MASLYPGALDSFTGKTDNVDTILASHVNDLQNSVVAVQTELGVDPAGSYSTVADRLDAVASNVHKWEGTISNPQAVYAQRAQLPIGLTTVAITVTSVTVRLNDSTPGAELAWDLKFADDIFTGSFANATVVVAADTTSGAATITSSFTDATIPAGKYVYWQFDSSPHTDIKDIFAQILYTID